MAENYIGLQHYTEEKAYLFKGRGRDAQDLYDLIVRNDYTVCYSDSGEGKSSLINAGVFPLLRSSMFFPVSIVFNQDDYDNDDICFDDIVDKRIHEAINDYNERTNNNVEYNLSSEDFADFPNKNELQSQIEKYSWWKLRNYKPQVAGIDLIPVYVFDQFEEVFNRPKSELWTAKFFTWLEEVSTDLCPDKIISVVRNVIGHEESFPAINREKKFHALFSLRNEFVGELDYWCMQRHFIPSLKNCRFCLKPLTCQNAKEIIAIGNFPERTSDEIIRSLGGSLSNEDIPCISALMLSVICTSLVENKSKTIKKDIEAFKDPEERISYIVNLFYLQTLDGLKRERVEKDGSKSVAKLEIPTKALRIIEKSLIDDNGKKIRVSPDASHSLKKIRFEEKYLDSLERGRLIRTYKFGNHKYVELIHDKLAETIDRRVKKRFSEVIRRNAIVALVALLVLLFGLTLYVGVNLGHPQHYYVSPFLSKLSQLAISSEDTVFFCNHNSIKNNSLVETFKLNRQGAYYIEDCPQLKEIIVGDENIYRLNVNLKACPKLKDLFTGSSLESLTLTLKDSVDAKIHIAKNVKKISVTNDLFCHSRLNFDIDEENDNFLFDNNILWDLKGKEIVYANSNASTIVEFPECIDKSECYYDDGECYKKLVYRSYNDYNDAIIDRNVALKWIAKEIKINKSVKKIERYAFAGLDSLEEVCFDPDCQPEIDICAFAYCKNLKRVYLPNKLKNHFRLKEGWKNNIFSECNNINYYVNKCDSNVFRKDNNGVIWAPRVYGSNSTDTIAVFFSSYTHLTDKISLVDFVPNDSLMEGISYTKILDGFLYVFPQGAIHIYNRDEKGEVHLPLRWEFIAPDENQVVNIIIINCEHVKKIHLPYVHPYTWVDNSRIKKKNEVRFNIELMGCEDYSNITLVVPKGCKEYYENDIHFKKFIHIEEESSSFLPYYRLFLYSYNQVKRSFLNDGVLLSVLFVVGIFLYSSLINVLMLFHFRRKGKETVSMLKLALNTLLFVFMGLFSYTVFFWLCAYLTSFGIWGCNIIAISVTLIISLAFMYLLYIAGNWKQFVNEYKSYLKHTMQKLKVWTKNCIPLSIIHLKENWKKYSFVILLATVSYSIFIFQRRNDIDEMVTDKNWERVSRLAYGQLMSADSIGSKTRSWARSMLYNGCGYNMVPKWSFKNSHHQNVIWCDDGLCYISGDSIAIFDYNTGGLFIEPKGIQPYDFVSKSYYVSKHGDSIVVCPYRDKNIPSFSNFWDKNNLNLKVLNDRFLFVSSSSDSLLLVSDLTKGVNGIIFSCDHHVTPYSGSTICTWVDKNEKVIYSLNTSTGDIYINDCPDGFAHFYDKCNLPIFSLDAKYKEEYYVLDIYNNKMIPINTGKDKNFFGRGLDYCCSKNNDTLYVYREEKERIVECAMPAWRAYNAANSFLILLGEGKTNYYHIETNTFTELDHSLLLSYLSREDTIMFGSRPGNDSTFVFRVGNMYPELIGGVRNEGVEFEKDFWLNGLKTEFNGKNMLIRDIRTGELLNVCEVGDEIIKITANYLVTYNKDSDQLTVYALDGSNVPIIINLKIDNDNNSDKKKRILCSICNDWIVVEEAERDDVMIYKLPSLKEVIQGNKYLNQEEKKKLMVKLVK